MESANAMLNQVKSASSTTTGALVVTILASVVVILLIAFILYWLVTRYVQHRKGVFIQDTYVPVITSALQTFDGSSLPSLDNGRRFTLTFWIYIYDLERFKGVYRNVFYIGNETGNITNESQTSSAPVSIVLDDESNKLYVLFGSNSVYGDLDGYATDASTVASSVKKKFISLDPNTDDAVDARTKKIEYIAAKRGISVDYIPQQRWAHVAIVVNETVNGGFIEAYMDGELVKVNNTKKASNVNLYKSSTGDAPENVKLDLQSMTYTIAGNVFVGGSAAIDDATVGFSGLVSKIGMYNYDLNAKDIYSIYLAGPVFSAMSKIGLAQYGVQSPLKRIG